MTNADLRLEAPQLLLDDPLLTLAADDRPSVAEDGGTLRVGQMLILEDTGQKYYWTGSAWAAVSFAQEMDLQTQLLRAILARLPED